MFTGKINEFETKNLLLLSKLDRLNSTVAEDKEIQINTIKGLERLGDSLASIKVDMMNKNEEEDMKALENKVHTLDNQSRTNNGRFYYLSDRVTDHSSLAYNYQYICKYLYSFLPVDSTIFAYEGWQTSSFSQLVPFSPGRLQDSVFSFHDDAESLETFSAILEPLSTS